MSEHSVIGWTDATWNPVTGCSRVSPGCEHCYAETLSLRMGWSKKPWTNQNAAENVKLHPERLGAPSRWHRPRMVFVNSMSDLFHPLIPEDFIRRVFEIMRDEIRHTFQVLTKRPERMRDVVRGLPMDVRLLDNIWLGTSVEDQRRADERIPLLLQTPAAVRFISAEPLLGPLDLNSHFLGWCQEHDCESGFCVPRDHVGVEHLSWVIVGGETGRNHRPMETSWAEKIATQCAESHVALFVKQDSGPRPGKQGRLSDALWKRKEYPVGVGQQRDLEGL